MAGALRAVAPWSRPRRQWPGSRCSGSNCRKDARGSAPGPARPAVSTDPARPSACPACNSRIAAHCDRGTRPADRRPRRCRTIPRWSATDAPCACTASIRQERTMSPLTRTVQAPQTPCSQPTCVPVSCRCSRRKSARLSRGRTCASTRSPLTSSEIGNGSRHARSPDIEIGTAKQRGHATPSSAPSPDAGASRRTPADPPGGSSSLPSAADASDNTAGVMGTSIRPFAPWPIPAGHRRQRRPGGGR